MGEVLKQTYLATASSFRNLMADEDFRTVLKAEDILTMPQQSRSGTLHSRDCRLLSMATSGPTPGSVGIPKNGLALEQISASLPTDFEMIRREQGDSTGICSNAIDLLKTHAVTVSSLLLLKRMKPIRQIEVAEQMVTSSIYSAGFIRVLMYATKPEFLVEGFQERQNRSWSEMATQHFARESETLLRDLRRIKSDLARESLYLTVFQAYIGRLLENVKVRRYLERKHPGILGVLQLSELTAQQSALTAGPLKSNSKSSAMKRR
jgi:hypothetical protein